METLAFLSSEAEGALIRSAQEMSSTAAFSLARRVRPLFQRSFCSSSPKKPPTQRTKVLGHGADVFALNIGSNTSNVAISRQPYHSSSPVPFPTYAPCIVLASLPTPRASFRPLPAASTTILHDMSDPISGTNRITNLVKPSSFLTAPPSSSTMGPPVSLYVGTAPAVHPPLNLQRPYGTPLLQHFPPNSTTVSYS